MPGEKEAKNQLKARPIDRAAWHYDAERDTNPPVKHPMLGGALWVATATQWPAGQLCGRQARSLQTCTNRSTDIRHHRMRHWPLIDTSLKALHTAYQSADVAMSEANQDVCSSKQSQRSSAPTPGRSAGQAQSGQSSSHFLFHWSSKNIF